MRERIAAGESFRLRRGPLAVPTGVKKALPTPRQVEEVQRQRRAGKTFMRGLELANRPFEAGAEVLADINALGGVKGSPLNLAAQERLKEVLTAESPKAGLGKLVEQQAQRPLAEQIIL